MCNFSNADPSIAAAKNNTLKRGVKEVVKALRKSPPSAPGYTSFPGLVIIAGDIDPVVKTDVHAAALGREVPGAKLVVLPGVGHMLQYVAADTVVAEIEALAAVGHRDPVGAASWSARAWLGRPGLVEGAPADLLVLDAPSAAHLAYRPGVPLTYALWEAGERVV